MTFHFVTLFPGAFKSYLEESIIARAIREKKIKAAFYNPRSYTRDKWRRVDRKPYGGGPGMVIEALPVGKAVEDALKKGKGKAKIIFLTPGGKQFTNTYAEKLAKKHKHLIVICGRYEGIDARVKKMFKAEEVSIGPYTLTGGELPAMMVMDAVARRIPGVLGKTESLEEKRISSKDVYTRPEVISYKDKKYRVPKVLLSGHHSNIGKWKSRHR